MRALSFHGGERERKSRDETTLGLCTEFLRPRLEKSENSARKVEG